MINSDEICYAVSFYYKFVIYDKNFHEKFVLEPYQKNYFLHYRQ